MLLAAAPPTQRFLSVPPFADIDGPARVPPAPSPVAPPRTYRSKVFVRNSGRSPPPPSPPPPPFPGLVIVEGPADVAAVRRAVSCAVAATRGTPPAPGRSGYALPPAPLAALLAAASAAGRVTVLADPDAGGRAMRSALAAYLSKQRCDATGAAVDIRHAFVSASQCTQSFASGGRRRSDTGVSRAAPAALRAALHAAVVERKDRRGGGGGGGEAGGQSATGADDSSAAAADTGASREEEPPLTAAELQSLGLAGAHGASPPACDAWGGAGVGARRSRVGALLGFGACDGTAFLKAFNAYGFGRAALHAAIREMEAEQGGNKGGGVT